MKEAVSIHREGRAQGQCPIQVDPEQGGEVRVLQGAVAVPVRMAVTASEAEALTPAPSLDGSVSQLPPSASLTLEVISNKTLTSIHRCVSLSLL